MDVLRAARGYWGQQPSFLAPGEEAACSRPFELECLRVTARRNFGNVCISPASMDAALRLLAEGMGETDRTATLRRLGPSAGPIEPQKGPGYELAHGTALFVEGSDDFLPDFEAQAAHVGAHLECGNGSLAALKDTINAYIATNSLGIFRGAINQKELSKTPNLLVDAIGFKGTWENKFPTSDTERGYPFFASPSRTTPCDMMFMCNKRMPVAETPTYLGVDFGYKTYGSQPTVRFSAFMPQADATIEDVLDALQREGFPRTYQQEQLGRLGLPRFKVEQRHDDLNQILQQTGIHTLGAPLFVTTGDYLEVKRSVQTVSLEVDEEGTVAAAVTTFLIGLGCARPLPPKRDIIFNRPFAFFIRGGLELGHLLFAGVFAGEGTF